MGRRCGSRSTRRKGQWQNASTGEKVAGRVGEAAGALLRAAGEVLEQAKALGPEQVELSFSLKVTGEVGWASAKAGTEGSFEVKLSWSSPREAAERAEPGEPDAVGE
jgi:Trypsin-co-occurring domain 1